MEIASLQQTLQRIQAIEKNFQSLNNVSLTQNNKDFQSILNSTISSGAYSDATPSEIDALITKYSEANNLDKDFVKALIKQESGFQPNVTSHCGAMGLMQLMPGTAKGLGVQNAYNPEENIAGGTKYIKNLLNKYDGNKELALAAYNAGSGAVQKYGGIPPYKETQNYVKNVLNIYQGYKSRGTL